MQIMRTAVKHVMLEWQQQMQLALPAAPLCAVLQLSLDLRWLEHSLQPYLTAAGLRLLPSSRHMLTQSVIRSLCSKDPGIAAVQAVHGSCSMSSSAITAWLASIAGQGLQQVLQDAAYSSQCLADGAVIGNTAASTPLLPGLASLWSSSEGSSQGNSDAPASPRRLVPSRPKAYVQSRLIGASSSSAAALAALQGKFGRQQSIINMPRSPGIKAVHVRMSSLSSQLSFQRSPSLDMPASSVKTSMLAGASSLAASPRGASRLQALGTGGSAAWSKQVDDSRSIPFGQQASRTVRPKGLHNQASISLTAMAAARLAPLQIPP